jgi:Zn-dependent peptidase ImmA (M78 family)/DNA-binding XRE family transcriptional regulator
MFNGQMLTLARARAGLTQAELARRSGVNQPRLSRLEHELAPATDEEAEALSVALDVPPSFFQRDESHRFFAVPPLFRLRRKVSQRRLDQLNAELVSRAMHLRIYTESVHIAPSLDAPPQMRDEASPEEAAQLLRHLWLLRPGPIPNLTRLIEAAGIFVVEMRVPERDFDGFSFRAPGHPTIIFVREGQPTDRRRFTLAHEIGHLMLHRVAGEKVEEQANAFAAELLMPATEARARLHAGVRLATLRTLKPAWGVSLAFLINRAAQEGFLSAVQKSRMFREMNARGWLQEEPDPLPPETPQLLDRVLRVFTNDLAYSPAEMAAVVHEHPRSLESRYRIGYTPALPSPLDGSVNDAPRPALRVL